MRDTEEDEWNKVKLVILLLQPFKIFTEEIYGKNYVVVSKLYIVFTSIKNHLNDCSKKISILCINQFLKICFLNKITIGKK
jgi:hypothetical protein